MFSKVNELVARYATKVSEHNKKRKDKIKMRLTEELWTFLSKNDFYISLWSKEYKKMIEYKIFVCKIIIIRSNL